MYTAPATGDNCSTEGAIKMTGGNTQYEGRVELCYGGNWGLICPLYWSNNDAKVVCRQLGYPTIGTLI